MKDDFGFRVSCRVKDNECKRVISILCFIYFNFGFGILLMDELVKCCCFVFWKGFFGEIFRWVLVVRSL